MASATFGINNSFESTQRDLRRLAGEFTNTGRTLDGLMNTIIEMQRDFRALSTVVVTAAQQMVESAKASKQQAESNQKMAAAAREAATEARKQAEAQQAAAAAARAQQRAQEEANAASRRAIEASTGITHANNQQESGWQELDSILRKLTDDERALIQALKLQSDQATRYIRVGAEMFEVTADNADAVRLLAQAYQSSLTPAEKTQQTIQRMKRELPDAVKNTEEYAKAIAFLSRQEAERVTREEQNKSRSLSMLIDELKQSIATMVPFGNTIIQMTQRVSEFKETASKAADEAGDMAKAYANATGELKLVDGNAVAAVSSFKNLLSTGVLLTAGLAAVAAAGVGVAYTLGTIGVQTAGTINELHLLAQRAGMTTESFSQLRLMAELYHFDMNELVSSFIQLSGVMADAQRDGSEQQRIFQSLGIAYQDANGKLRNTLDVTLDAADAIVRMTSATEQANAAQRLFGEDSAAKLLPVLRQGSDAIRALITENGRLGLSIGAEAVENAQRYARSVTTIEQAWKGFKETVGSAVLPVLASLAEGLASVFSGPKVATQVQQITKLKEELLDLNGQLKKVYDDPSISNEKRVYEIQQLVASIQRVNIDLANMEKAQKDAGKAGAAAAAMTQDQIKALQQMKNALEDARAATLEGQKKIIAARDAELRKIDEEVEAAKRAKSGSEEFYAAAEARRVAVRDNARKQIAKLAEEEADAEKMASAKAREKMAKDLDDAVEGLARSGTKLIKQWETIVDEAPRFTAIVVEAFDPAKIEAAAAAVGTVTTSVHGAKTASDGLLGVITDIVSVDYEKVFKKAGTVIDDIGKGLSVASSIGGGLFSIVDQVVGAATGEGLMDLIKGGPGAAQKLAEGLANIDFSGMVTNLTDNIVGILETLGDNDDIWNSIIDGAVRAVEILATKAVPAAIRLVISMVKAFVDHIGEITMALVDAGFSLVFGIIQAIPAILPALIGLIPTFAAHLIMGIVGNLPVLIAALAAGVVAVVLNMVAGILDFMGFSKQAEELRKSSDQFVTGAIEATGGGAPTMTPAGGGGGAGGTGGGGISGPGPNAQPTDSSTGYKADFEFSDGSAQPSNMTRYIKVAPYDKVDAYQPGGANDPRVDRVTLIAGLRELAGLMARNNQLLEEYLEGNRGDRPAPEQNPKTGRNLQ